MPPPSKPATCSGSSTARRARSCSKARTGNRLAERSGGVEFYRSETIELRAGDRIRWTRNDASLGLVNSQTAEVPAVREVAVSRGTATGRREEA